ncbi:MAG TPA: hypothetical protein VMW54_15185 [Terriglobia bacterium]|nr:hypothetical protein [Terriglobia bacterium]
MVLSVAILLVIGMAAFVAAPLLAPESPGEGALPIDVTPLTDLKRRRMVVYENLQDLDFEYKAGKLSPGDYQSLRENHLAEAAQLMLASQEQEEVTENDVLIERQVAERRAQRKQQPHDPYTCPGCGFENPLPVKFCGNCGTQLPQQAPK